MLAALTKALTSPAAGPAASAAALVLAGLLAANWSASSRSEAALNAQIAALSTHARASGVYWKAELAACQAEAATNKAPIGGEITRVAGDDEAVARRLANQGPAGFDVCARMEAADQAVLASLKAR